MLVICAAPTKLAYEEDEVTLSQQSKQLNFLDPTTFFDPNNFLNPINFLQAFNPFMFFPNPAAFFPAPVMLMDPVPTVEATLA